MSMRAAELVSADLTGPRPGVEETLTMTGAKTVPGQVDVGSIDLVYDVGAAGFAKPTWKIAEVTSAAVVASAFGNFVCLGPTGFTVAGFLGNTGESLNQEVARVIGAQVEVAFDAAGLAAFAGKKLRGTFELSNADASIRFPVWDHIIEVAAAMGSIYRFTLNGGFWNGLVPTQWAVVAGILNLDGVAFPANTTMRLRGFAYVKRKNGAAVPI